MLGTQTRGGKMEGADESTVLWRHHPIIDRLYCNKGISINKKVGYRHRSLALIDMYLDTTKGIGNI